MVCLSIQASAQSDEQFDLNCSGTLVAVDTGAKDFDSLPFEKGPVPYSTHLRVDLNAKVFCQDDCKAPEAIVGFNPETILFRDNQGVFQKSRLAARRSDGAFAYSWTEPGDRATRRAFLTKTVTGQCSKAPFTPLPHNAF
jgi:hypothetical protein